MYKPLAAIFLILPTFAIAQSPPTGSINRQQIQSSINTNLPTNDSGQITASALRGVLTSINNSAFLWQSDTIPITRGGTGSTTAVQARTNLGAAASNAAITINGQSCVLSSSCTITAAAASIVPNTTIFSCAQAGTVAISSGSGGTIGCAGVSGPANIVFNGGNGGTFAPLMTVNVTGESYTAGSGFFITQAILANKFGGTGHREALHIEQLSSSSSVGEFVVGLNTIGHGTGTSSGNVFGGGAAAICDANVAVTTECSGAEFNTWVIAPTVTRKTGVQIVDVTGSVGVGSSIDAALWIASQGGAVGYANGVQFASGSVKSTGTLIKADGISVAKGIDFASATFSGNAIATPGYSVTGGANINQVVPVGVAVTINSASNPDGGLIHLFDGVGGKYIKSIGGTFSILNGALSQTLFTLDDSGNAATAGTLTTGSILSVVDAISQNAITVNGTGNTNGASLQLFASASPGAAKTFRAIGSNLEIVNAAYNAVLFTLSDTGGLTTPGLPTSAGGGGLTLCIDTSGVIYKKALCP